MTPVQNKLMGDWEGCQKPLLILFSIYIKKERRADRWKKKKIYNPMG